MSRRKLNVNFGFGNPIDTQEIAIQTKGGPVTFDEQKVRGWLRSLVPYAGVQLVDLRGDPQTAFNNIKTYVTLLYETTIYDTLYGIVLEEFASVTSFVPGTVGAYYKGCILDSAYQGQKGCAVTCVNSMPPPRSDRNFKYCEYGVIRSVYDSRSGQYVFIPDKEDTSGTYYLYLEGSYYLNDSQKAQLVKMGAGKVWVKGPNGVDYSNGWIAVADIPSAQPSSGDGGEAIFAFVFIFLIILLLCFVRN